MNLQHTKNGRKRQGFTLAELMVVIVIIGLLATLVTTDVMGIFTDAKGKKVRADINAIDQAVQNYTMRNNGEPDGLEILIQPDENGYRFLNKSIVPKDPWGNEYLFEQSIGQAAALHPAGHEIGTARFAPVVEQGQHMRVIEAGYELGLDFEPVDELRVVGQLGTEDLDRDLTLEARVPGAVDLPHASGAERRLDLIGAEAPS